MKKLLALCTVVFSVLFVVVSLSWAGIVRRSNSGSEPHRSREVPPAQYESRATPPPDAGWSARDWSDQKSKEKEKSDEPKRKREDEETRKPERRKTYDNFIDRNGNGIDDRYEKKTRGTEEAGSKKKKKPGE